eukprot:UN10400
MQIHIYMLLGNGVVQKKFLGCINEDMSILHDLAEYEPYFAVSDR